MLWCSSSDCKKDAKSDLGRRHEWPWVARFSDRPRAAVEALVEFVELLVELVELFVEFAANPSNFSPYASRYAARLAQVVGSASASKR